MHSLGSDLLILWVAAIVFAFAAFMAQGFSIHDGGLEDKISWWSAPAILLAAVVITVLQLIGVIGVW